MEATRLIKSYSFESDDVTDESNKQLNRSLRSRFQWFLFALNLLLGVLIIVLVIVITILVGGKTNPVSACAAEQSPTTGDYNQFVPTSVTSKTVLRASGPDKYQIMPEIFQDLSAFNHSLIAWKRVAHGFLRATPYNGKGPQKPLASNIFEISAFHQMHCLTNILEDFALMATGVPVHQLPGYSSGVLLTWAEQKAHCFHYVRQALMCFADPTTEGRAEDNPHKVAESGVIHVCNDFEGLLDWATHPDRKLPDTWKIFD